GVLHTALEPFRDSWKRALAEQAREHTRSRLRAAEHDLQAAKSATAQARSALDVAHRVVAERGGTALELQRMAISGDEARLASAVTARDQLAGDLQQVGVPMPATFEEFEELRASARAE